ncbi:MAG TPA: hypothetical protein VMW24_23340 [Sedimentisphaerales bacterium]|nr:hypothetical protein [Sedimentisphaerales bacterium]
MTQYKTEDGTIIDTDWDKASQHWHEAQDWDGSNNIGRSSRSQWLDQILYRSRRGRYYIETASRIQGKRDGVEWVSPQEATRWLLVNGHNVPEELVHLVDEVSE